jgi:hypothetical protein
MRIAYDSSFELINDIADAWRRPKRPAFTLPYNRFAWEASKHWWVVPSSEKVAFRYSKISVASSDFLAPAKGVFVGLYVEKGVGAVMAAAGASNEWIMGGDWRWHGLVRDLSRGKLQPALAESSRRLGTPLEIRVEAHVPIRGGAIRPPHDRLVFGCSDGDKVATLTEPILKTDEKFLKQAASADTVQLLGTAMLSIPQSDWAWVNLYIGVGCEFAPKHDTTALDAYQLADRLLEPLAPWLD